MSIFVNLTAHQLTDEQKEVARKELKVTDFVEYKEVYPDLFGEMANSPNEESDLEKLSAKVICSMFDMVAQTQGVLFHLPIGSPAFNFALAKLIANAPQLQGRILFSHSERVSKETMFPDGTVKKENVFLFKKFIKF